MAPRRRGNERRAYGPDRSTARRALVIDSRRSRQPTDSARRATSFDFDGDRLFTVREAQLEDDPARNGSGSSRPAVERRAAKHSALRPFRRRLSRCRRYATTVDDDSTGAFADAKVYVVQTSTKVIERCMLMCTDPGDLVLDPTCGSGTTAFVAEQWGRRWITIDTSRVALALARQRLMGGEVPVVPACRLAGGPREGAVADRPGAARGRHSATTSGTASSTSACSTSR